MKSFKFTVSDPGDPSVGIRPVYEEITFSFEFGGHDNESVKELIETMKNLLASHIGGEVESRCEVEEL